MKKTVLVLLPVCVAHFAFAQTAVLALRTENAVNPLGVDAVTPRFSWQLSGAKRNTMQTAYDITVFSPDKKIAWHSGKTSSSQSVYVPYAGSTLESGKRYKWIVQVWDNNGTAPSKSDTAFFQMAFLNTGDWKAKWIGPGFTEDSTRPSPLLRKTFTTNKRIASATAYITAHGMYEAQINGQRVGDAYFTPGWTSYNKRLQYQVYDVTKLLVNGTNAIGVTLANGWYRGFIGFSGQQNVYGKDIALLMQIEISYNDGSTERIITDESWKSSTGAIRSSEIYNGEFTDRRLEKQGWSLANYDDSKWDGVSLVNGDMKTLIATYNEPVRPIDTIGVAEVLKTPKGETVIDFRVNAVGWVAFKLKGKGKAGDKIIISHAEVLDKAGNFYTENLRAAKAQDVYILKGGETEILQPHFTWHGFRYIRIEGYPGDINPGDFKLIGFHSDMANTGTFTSSSNLVNRLQGNIRWGQKGNFIDVPTDCPQRDERLGWTGDAQVFSRTASFNMDVHNFFVKWLKDVAADQLENGSVPHVIPNVLGKGAAGSAGWADVANIIPWNMYLAYGDKKILEDQYPSMQAWVNYITGVSKNDLWNTGSHFGDWLFYRPDDDNDGRAAVTDKHLIAQCFYANSTQLLINAAKVLNRTEDVKTYELLLKRIKDAFINEYMTAGGRLVSGTQTALVLALNFDMLPEGLRQQAAQRLVDNIKSYGNHLTTGFLGTPYLCHVLTRFGFTDVAYKLLLQETYPSWLYPVKMGATTIWERWDGIKPNGTFQTPGMNSFNHYAYGAIGDWMYRVMAGLDTYEDGPGYKHIRIQPHIGGGFTNASATLKTFYGTLSSGWKIEGGKLMMDVTIPLNTTATLFVPASNVDQVTENNKPLGSIKEIKTGEAGSGYLSLTLGSGEYHFVVNGVPDQKPANN
ncbi:family 78 glycoside hydrolase catalytic domain [Sediminibacterium roseum]|uniref:alpha-L-rhamnosidase n=1 Tax=Sediminibacterium roseum TaxID=1978412 RepID=A0ABW9ZT48_9BACT|nr:alpha-L-rhamnosidase [Sediminibacterium roseum]NCI49665.1 family 78 glycoside hydrolase catalytic domain [Sediminibacterium roseum]